MLELARPRDRDAVNGLASQIHAMHVAWRPDIYEPAEELYPQERFLAEIQHRRLYVAKIGDAIIGYAAVKFHSYDRPGLVQRKVMLVEEICVEERCRHQGLGQQMMLELRVLARAFGCTDMQLTVDPHNDHAVGFYQKCGFTIKSIGVQRNV